MVKIIECPRDAMQGIHEFIPTATKIDYINQLLAVGFDTIDFGSFVSPKAIPQLKDTAEVLDGLTTNTTSKLLAIVANTRGAVEALEFDRIDYLGYPFSISETFQQRNTNASIEESLKRVEKIQNLVVKHNKKLVIYISMAFGNPYGDKWDLDIASDWSTKLHKELGIEIIALSDTIGVSNPLNIKELFDGLIPALPNVEFGAHLHSTPEKVWEKVEAAYLAGCKRFDGAINGFGGCPMASDDLTGNMVTESMKMYFDKNNVDTNIDNNEFEKALEKAQFVF